MRYSLGFKLAYPFAYVTDSLSLSCWGWVVVQAVGDVVLNFCWILVIAEGLGFGKLAFLAHCNGAKVEVFQTNLCTIDDFRNYVLKCATSTDYHMVSYFDRSHFKQIGGSHISPIGAYHGGRDLVLVMDVSRFEYPPFWIPLTLLWQAMTSIDKATGNHMGFMVLTRLPYDPCVLYTLSCRDGSWIRTANHLSQIPLLLESEDVKDVNQILSVLFMSVSTNFSVFIKQVAEAKGKDGHVHSSKRKRKRLTTQGQLLMQLRETELHKRVSKWMDSMNSDSGFVTSSGNQHALLEIAANVASDGVKHSTLNPGSSGRLYSTDSVGSSKGNYERVSVEMSEPVICSREQGPGKMIQTIDPSPSGCSVNNGHFICKDALTMLLLALPSHMWSGIKEPNLSAEFNSLVSIESVPHILKKEVGNWYNVVYIYAFFILFLDDKNMFMMVLLPKVVIQSKAIFFSSHPTPHTLPVVSFFTLDVLLLLITLVDFDTVQENWDAHNTTKLQVLIWINYIDLLRSLVKL
ncbi:hypothetical protein HYC85_009203 [Camellia sinensis]|uniref:glutathione gamma-glutamylcysteinyltransferase n=1 Tax=Camellia sinensis TaxID=4442 RepID=A0A7J7HEY2_CAMSI|nr:hypothetical protein HYC85_009203 [Camellia sinensis]